MHSRFVVTLSTTPDDIAAAGRPDPLYCKPGLGQHAQYLADIIDSAMGGDLSCGGGSLGYVPDILEIEE